MHGAGTPEIPEYLGVSIYLQRMRFCHPGYSRALREPRGLLVTSMHFPNQGFICSHNISGHLEEQETEGLRIVTQNWKEQGKFRKGMYKC